MKKTNLLIIISSVIVTVFLLCSCSRGSTTRAGDSLRNSARRTENFMDNGLNAVENGVENGNSTVVGGGMYGANSGYSGNAGIGTNSAGTGGSTAVAQGGRATPLLPTLGDKSRDNRGQINSNNGSLDGGMGDLRDNNDTKKNSKK